MIENSSIFFKGQMLVINCTSLIFWLVDQMTRVIRNSFTYLNEGVWILTPVTTSDQEISIFLPIQVNTISNELQNNMLMDKKKL